MTKTFTKGSTTYTCVCCGHLTRNTGEQAIDSNLCPMCWDLAGYENMEQDGYIEESDKVAINSIFRAIRKRSEVEFQKAFAGCGIINHYYTDNASTGNDEIKVTIEMTDSSTIKGPVAMCKALFPIYKDDRKAFIAAAMSEGVCKATASTQYNRIKKGA